MGTPLIWRDRTKNLIWVRCWRGRLHRLPGLVPLFNALLTISGRPRRRITVESKRKAVSDDCKTFRADWRTGTAVRVVCFRPVNISIESLAAAEPLPGERADGQPDC